MNKYKFLLTAISIVIVSTLPAIYVCIKSIEGFNALLTDREVASRFESIAEKVTAGSYSSEQISSKFLSLAAAERQVEFGIGTVTESYYFYILAFVFIGVLQALLIGVLVGLKRS